MKSRSFNNSFQTLILIVCVLACSRAVAQRPVSAGLEVIYSSKPSNVRINYEDSVFHAATLSNNGEFLLHSDAVEGLVKLVDLRSLKVETIKVDRLHHASWFASESQHIYEIRSTSPSISKAAAANDGNEDLYCYKSLDDFRNNRVQWSFHNINTVQFVVRWVPELERFLLSNSATPNDIVRGPTTLFVLKENGDIEKEFPVEGCTLDFDCRSNGISIFHNPNFKKVSFKHTQIDQSGVLGERVRGI